MLIPESIQELLNMFSFRGNAKLRPAGAQIEYTEEMLAEYIKCKQDPVYFIKNYIYVVHPDRGLVKFELYDYQEKMINAYRDNKKVIFLTSRQQGKTTVSAAYFVWYIIFNDQKSVAIFANKQKTADEIMSRVRLAYENLPVWLQQGVSTWNKRSIELENGSKCAGSATSASGNRGGSVSILYLDEFAFVPNGQAEDFFTAVYPTISAGENTQVFMTSTPNGYNHFHKFWAEAHKKPGEGYNGFTPIRIYWYETPGRDQKWYDDQKAVLGELKAAQELDAEFLGSSMTLLTGSVLSRLVHSVPVREYADHYKGLKIYTEPLVGHAYSMAVDVSRGRHLDASAFIVYDITKYPHTIAATYKNNEISPLLYASLIQKIGLAYNKAYLLIEINDIGAQVADTLWNDLEYEEMHWTKSGDQLGKSGADPYPGIRTTKKTKRIGCSNLKDMIDNNQLIVNDYDLIHELSTFVQSKTGSYEADDGFHDDLVMCGVLHAWLASQRWFGDLTDTNLRETMHTNHMKEMEDQLCMVGGYSDGVDEIVEAEHRESFEDGLHSWNGF